MTLNIALNQMLLLDGVFLWTNHNSLDINVSELSHLIKQLLTFDISWHNIYQPKKW